MVNYFGFLNISPDVFASFVAISTIIIL